MTLGFVMLVHESLDRAAQVARYWARSGCPIVIHVDARVAQEDYDTLVTEMAEFGDVLFSGRRTCDWGTWSLVQASQDASSLLLDRFPAVRHVYLASGTCMPLRPTADLVDFLDGQPNTDFIESVTTRHVPWTIGGLDEERFTLTFPFGWKRRRWLFDAWVRLQRRVGRKRRIPAGIEPHLGSQWWCLTRQTLSAILEDPNRATFERYFRKVWIPDESYYQTLARRYARKIDSRSLTLAKFDHQGKPHIFYDDHLDLLRKSDRFVARKVWSGAERLYNTFLAPGATGPAHPDPAALDRIFTRALDRRTRGRAGLYMQSRFPRWDWENGRTAAPYSVLCGFSDLFEGFGSWLSREAECLSHGHLFAPEGAEYAGGMTAFAGGLATSARLRDHNPIAFLTSLIWNTRGERQCLLYGPRDNQDVSWFFATDPNARITVISGAWAVPLFQQNRNFGEIRAEAAVLQQREAYFINYLRGAETKAQVRICTMAEFLEDPVERLSTLVDEIGAREPGRPVIETPRLRALDGFPGFLQTLRNQGMNPYLVGDFPVEIDWTGPPIRKITRPTIVR